MAITTMEALDILFGGLPDPSSRMHTAYGIVSQAIKIDEVKQKTNEECAVSFLMDESVHMQRFMGQLMQAMMLEHHMFVKNIYESMTKDEMKRFIKVSLDKIEKNLVGNDK